MELKDKKQSLEQLSSQWQLTHNETRLYRQFKFKNFKHAFAFATQIAEISEKIFHHPEIHVGWGHCNIEIWSHNVNDLREQDFALAAKVDDVFNQLHPHP